MIAETCIGRGDLAHDYYLRINPSKLEEESDLHRTEPYVYAQMISGFEAVKEGEAKNSWLTGTAAWNYVAITQNILGIRPDFDGLHVEPVFPKSWPEFSVTRKFRGVEYEIAVKRTGLGDEIVIEADGKPVSGFVVPVPHDSRKLVKVTVKVS
jgi:cellobiose phosphorylase